MGPKVDKILEALTISKSNDILNLERCETLGDSFLKYAASLYTWSKFATYDEGQLTAIKSKIVSNRNLFYCAKLIDLGGRMKASQFKAKSDWLLPCFSVPPCVSDVLIDDKDIVNAPNLNLINLTTNECLTGQLTEESKELFNNVLSEVPKSNSIASMEIYFGKQTVKEKSVADSMESLIGVYLLDSGIETGFNLLRYFHILPCQNDLPDLLTKKIVTPFSSKTTSYAEINFQLDYCISNIEKIFNYKFKDPSLLLEALSHSSNLRNNITGCYQRLEFIGDAILDFLITCYIFENFPSLNPGDITDLRSALVNNVTFACIVVRHGLHKYILSSNVELDCAINKFANFQSGRNHVVDEAVLFLLEEDNCYLSNYVDVPKVLGDIFESLAGAIYLDSGNDLSVVWKLYNRLLHQEIEEFGAKIPKQPVRVLYEKVHSSPNFLESKVTTNGRIMVPLTFLKKGQKKIVHGFGFNRANAKRSAAKMALKMLNDIEM